MNRFLIEVTIKNILVIVLFFFILVPWLKQDLASMQLRDQGAVLSMLGFLMAGTIVAAFQLSYSQTDTSSALHRWLAHSTRFLLYLGICSLLYIAMWVVDIAKAGFRGSIGFPCVCIFFALFMHDYWDAINAQKRHNKTVQQDVLKRLRF